MNERQNGKSSQQTAHAPAKAEPPIQKGPLDASITGKIESSRRDLGQVLYGSILGAVAKVKSARDIPNQHLQQEVLKWMESGVRGMFQIRKAASEIPETKFYDILDRLEVRALDQIPTFAVLKQLVDATNDAAEHQADRTSRNHIS